MRNSAKHITEKRKMPSVALIRNRIDKGGILHVMAEMTRGLNERGIVPDFVTLKCRIDAEEIKASYGLDIEFRTREVFTDLKIPYEWHILFFNYICRWYLKKYDLVINHNNTSFLYQRPSAQSLINYIHFPRKARGIADVRSLYRPEGDKKRWYDYRSDFLKLASRMYRFHKLRDSEEIILANSGFTRAKIAETHRLKVNGIDVLYPPVRLESKKTTERKNSQLVVSLGRICKDKRQKLQIHIARKLPEYKFKILGFIGNKNYYDECKELIRRHEIQNVELIGNAPKQAVDEFLNNASIFLHSTWNEPFGITTVQAIDKGCIPIVPDQGGQIEIVPIRDLRYNRTEEAVSMIKQIGEKSEERLSQMRRRLQEHIQQFDRSHFQTRWNNILNEVIPYM